VKILIYGVSGYAQYQLCKNGCSWHLENVDFTDSNPQKWNQTFSIGQDTYRILPVSEIKAEEYDWCVIGCVAYEASIRDSVKTIGFPDTKILPAVFWESHFASWRKIVNYGLWEQWISNEQIRVVKNWYVNGNHTECILWIKGCAGYDIEFKNLQLIEDKTIFKVKKINSVEDESMSLHLNSENEILVVSADTPVPAQPFWLIPDLKKTAQQVALEHEKRYKLFSYVREEMQRFEYHDEDYLALRQFADRKGTVLDLGANYGQSMYAFYRLLPKAKIISVEAVPELASILVKYKEQFDSDGRIEVINVGLSDTDEDTLIFYEPEDCMVCGSFDKKFVEGFQTDTARFTITEKELQCRTLDSLFMELDDIFFIKMDVEGLEYQALSGGLEVIKKNQPVLLLEANVDYQKIKHFFGDDYERYNYIPDRDEFVMDAWVNASINYWLIPKKLITDNGKISLNSRK